MLSRIGRGVGRQWVVVAALVAALAGTAVAGSGKDITRGKAKKIARNQAAKQIEKMAPSLAVARADVASEATVADRAVVAREAATARRADAAVTAINAAAVGGTPATNLSSSIVFGEMETVPDLATSYTPYGIAESVGGALNEATPSIAPVRMELRDITVLASGLAAGESIDLDLAIDDVGGAPDPETRDLCVVTEASDTCSISGPIAVPEGAKLRFNTDGIGNSEDEAITYSYRLLRG